MNAEFRATLVALVLGLSGCTEGGNGGDDTGGDDTSDDTGTDTSDTDSGDTDSGDTDSGDTGGTGTLIPAATGGTVTSPDGKMALEIPAGALSADTVITVEVVPQASWPNIVSYLQPITAVYRLGPDGTTFSAPAVATFDIAADQVDRLWTEFPWPYDPEFYGWAAPSAFLHDTGDPEAVPVLTTLQSDGTGTAEVEVAHFTDVFVALRTMNGSSAFHAQIGAPYERRLYQRWAEQVSVRSTEASQDFILLPVETGPAIDLGLPLGRNEIGLTIGAAATVDTFRVPVVCLGAGTGQVDYVLNVQPDNVGLRFKGPQITCVAPGATACGPGQALDPAALEPLHETDDAADPLASTLEAFNGCQAVVTETTSGTQQVLVDTSAFGARRADDYLVVSADGDGAGTDDSYDAALSADGRRGVFLTRADDLLGQTTGTEGAVLFSVASATGIPTLERFARTPATHRETYPAISGDGRWVAFNDHTSNTWILDADTSASTAVQLPSGLYPVVDRWGGNVAVSYYAGGYPYPYQIYVIDLDQDRDGENAIEASEGTFGTERVISLTPAGGYANGTSTHTRALGLSDTGRFVLYSSDATNLTTDVVPAEPHLFLHDRDADEDWVFDETGTGETSTEIVSRLPDGTIVSSPSVVGQRWLSGDGRYAVFQTYDLSGSAGDHAQVYVRDLGADTTALVTATSGDAPANGNSFNPLIAPDGRTIALVTTATDLPGVPAPSPSVAVVGPNPLYTAP